MAATVIDGKAFAADVRAKVGAHVTGLKADHGITPGLAVVLVGEDPASQVYVRSKGKMTVEVGMNSYEHKLEVDTPEADLLALIQKLNADPEVHGILVQLPLPKHLDEDLVINSIDPVKDVIGRSNIVGKPMAQLLLGDSCTVTIAHSRTKDLADVVRRADIVVAAVGRPQMVPGDWIKPGATVIDVGINRIEKEGGGTRLVGDADYDSCAEVAGAITPVPGGVGPMTIACLLANTVTACCRANGLPEPDGLTA
jgi:methylenetetrahydrofolate dehydrogenase (NADP+)/methenyltetrahydrofolate cyclohydrolase